jgi:endonuclease/exonuclease/phosphatase family metal-dependent hydrolase
MVRAFFVLMLLALVLAPTPSWADSLKVATWNIEHLRDGFGEGPNPRQQADFDRLKAYANILGADVIAFQEVENETAAERIFDPAEYRILVSERNHTQRTGFAVRRTLAVTRNPDLTALNTSGGLRHGVDITVTVGGQLIRMLSVHLKSGCFDRPLTYNSDACQKLHQQVPVLEGWIDARAAENIPFIILGDFNRRFDAPQEGMWEEIDDGNPLNADLWRITEGQEPLCWEREYAQFIDHIVFSRRAARWIDPYIFEQIIYQEDDALKDSLSDHCPIAVTLDVQ